MYTRACILHELEDQQCETTFELHVTCGRKASASAGARQGPLWALSLARLLFMESSCFWMSFHLRTHIYLLSFSISLSSYVLFSMLFFLSSFSFPIDPDFPKLRNLFTLPVLLEVCACTVSLPEFSTKLAISKHPWMTWNYIYEVRT